MNLVNEILCGYKYFDKLLQKGKLEKVAYILKTNAFLGAVPIS